MTNTELIGRIAAALIKGDLYERVRIIFHLEKNMEEHGYTGMRDALLKKILLLFFGGPKFLSRPLFGWVFQKSVL